MVFTALFGTTIIITYINTATAIEGTKKETYNNLQETLRLEKKFIKNWFYYREVDVANWAKVEKNVDFFEKKYFEKNS